MNLKKWQSGHNKIFIKLNIHFFGEEGWKLEIFET